MTFTIRQTRLMDPCLPKWLIWVGGRCCIWKPIERQSLVSSFIENRDELSSALDFPSSSLYINLSRTLLEHYYAKWNEDKLRWVHEATWEFLSKSLMRLSDLEGTSELPHTVWYKGHVPQFSFIIWLLCLGTFSMPDI